MKPAQPSLFDPLPPNVPPAPAQGLPDAPRAAEPSPTPDEPDLTIQVCGRPRRIWWLMSDGHPLAPFATPEEAETFKQEYRLLWQREEAGESWPADLMNYLAGAK